MCHALRQHLQQPVVLLNLDQFELFGQISESRDFALLCVEDQIGERKLKFPLDYSIFDDVACKPIYFFRADGLPNQLEKCDLSVDIHFGLCLVDQTIGDGNVKLRRQQHIISSFEARLLILDMVFN